MSTLLGALEKATEQAISSQQAAIDAVGMAEAMHEELEEVRQRQGSTEDFPSDSEEDSTEGVSTESDSSEDGFSDDGSLPPSKGWL